MSVRAFETDVNVGGIKGDCPPEYDSIKWHQQMAREGHLYQAMIGNDLVGAAIAFPDETGNSVYIGRIFIDSIYHRKERISRGLLSFIWIPHVGMSGQMLFTKD